MASGSGFFQISSVNIITMPKRKWSTESRRGICGAATMICSTAGPAMPLHSLRTTKELGIPSVLEIPTWHKHQGRVIPPQVEEERAMANDPIPKRWLNRLIVTRQDVLEEYELADLILVLSQKAEETFVFAGIPREKNYSAPHEEWMSTDSIRAQNRPKFRALFVGALIQRKGVSSPAASVEKAKTFRIANSFSSGIRIWKCKPYLQELPASVKIARISQTSRRNCTGECSVFIFPSELEGSAKSNLRSCRFWPCADHYQRIG